MLLKGKNSLIISEKIEMPDIAELLTYPNFTDVDIEDVYKYGTDFQKKLLDMCPIDTKMKNHSLLSGVKINIPGYRSCTGGDKRFNMYEQHKEWHIDNEEKFVNPHGEWIYHEATDIVTLLTSKTSAMTEFFENEFFLDIDPNKTSYEEVHDLVYKNFISGDPFNLGIFKAPAGRLITFTNHFHRAVEPLKIEFRYMFRLLQTNRSTPANRYVPIQDDYGTIMSGSDRIKVLDRINNGESIVITPPSGYQEAYQKYSSENKFASIKKDKENDSMDFDKFKDYDFYFNEDADSEIEKVEIIKAIVNFEGLSKNCSLRDFVFPGKLSVILLSNKSYDDQSSNKAFLEFVQKADRDISFVGEDGSILKGHISQDFCAADDVLGTIAGGIAYVRDESAIIPGMKYTLKTDETQKNIFKLIEEINVVLK